MSDEAASTASTPTSAGGSAPTDSMSAEEAAARVARRRASRRSDMLILGLAVLFMGTLGLGIFWLSIATGMTPGEACTTYHQLLGHC